ncbi:hypothetical protein GIB67_040296 [Kingdonia uniflora]|uniref:SBP-type domain-containing protein n=1 Tax=Kingdonia uniflora TaxID=39325 RepID=A0A7J7MVF6_9MAGN|nr:hypothetical protein GIB67_040296 [Kingdonia uniflora]
MSYFPVSAMGEAASNASSDYGLSFGKKIYFEDVCIGVSVKSSGGSSSVSPEEEEEEDQVITVAVPAPTARKGGGGGRGGLSQQQQQQQTPRCQVEGCNLDLSSVKAYYSRHKVCGVHSKSPMVIVGGIEQRFCQQCSRYKEYQFNNGKWVPLRWSGVYYEDRSTLLRLCIWCRGMDLNRFHQLPEFDQGKRSCRRRLAGHNERRRKPPPGALFSSRYGRLTSSLQGQILYIEIVTVIMVHRLTKTSMRNTWLGSENSGENSVQCLGSEITALATNCWPNQVVNGETVEIYQSHIGHVNPCNLRENGRGGILMDFTTYPRLSGRDPWPSVRAGNWVSPANHQRTSASHERTSANSLPAYVTSHPYLQGGTLISESKVPPIPGECFAGVSDSDCALSLLSNQPWCSRNQPFMNDEGTGMGSMVNNFTSSSPWSFKENEASGSSSLSYEMPRSFGLRHSVNSQFTGELELAQHSELVNSRAYCPPNNQMHHWSL